MQTNAESTQRKSPSRSMRGSLTGTQSRVDTHLGSGSSRIAAYDAGLDFVGCEIDKDYFAKQEERFAAHTAQLSLFA